MYNVVTLLSPPSGLVLNRRWPRTEPTVLRLFMTTTNFILTLIFEYYSVNLGFPLCTVVFRDYMFWPWPLLISTWCRASGVPDAVRTTNVTA